MSREFTTDEVSRHNKESDCWVIIDGSVYDLTGFLPDHPGGKKAIMTFAGRDATEEFDMLHDRKVITKYVPKAKIGVVKKSKL
jgi:cytochrome b involved in lipid metabolism